MSDFPFRIKAFLLHLLCSVVLAIISTVLVLYVWYPSPLNIATEVTSIYWLLLAVDVILGPVLTLILATKPDKKGLKFDIAVIALCQMIAYGYGIYSVAKTRPVWIAFDQSRFDVVVANSIDYVETDKIAFQYLNPSWTGPKYIALKSPVDDKERTQRLFYELQTGFAPSMRAYLYRPLDEAWGEIIAKQHALSELSQADQAKILANYPQATGWLILKTYVNDMLVIIDSKQPAILGIENIDPNVSK